MGKHDAWYGIEQEYTLMKPGKVGEKATIPYGFNEDGSEPAPQGPYYTGAGTGIAIGRPVADEHLAKCLEAGVKIAGINAEVMPGQWEYQIGPCQGVEIGDHMTVARYIMYRVTESHNVVCSFSPKPRDGDWNGAGCHTNFSIKEMRAKGGYDVIKKVCEAFGKKRQSILLSTAKGMTSASQESMRHAASLSLNSVLPIVVHLFAFLALPKRREEATWKTAAQRQIVIRI